MRKLNLVKSVAVAAAVLTGNVAMADDSFEFNGYFRGGFTSSLEGGTGANGGSCYALAHPRNDGLYYRLGNECRDYADLSFTKKKSINGIDFKGVVLMDLAGDQDSSTQVAGFSRRPRQMYLEADGVFQDSDTKMWVGRRFYRSIAVGDIHINDAFHVNSSGNGFGFSDIAIGADSKLHVAFIAQGNEDEQNQLLDVRTDFGLGDAGRLKLALQQLINNEADGVNVTDGNTITAQWEKNLGGVFDQKTVIQVGSDAFASNPGCYGTDGAGNGNCYNTDPGQNGLTGTRIFNNGTWDLTDRFKMNTMVMIEDIDKTREVTSIGIRPHYQLSSPYWSVLGEIGINEVEPEGGPAQKLQKTTLALQLSGDASNFWERPSLRFFVSMFDWNDAAAAGSGLTVAGQPGQTDDVLWGAQGEFWF